MSKWVMAEKQAKKSTLSLGDRVKLIDYAKKNLGVGTRRVAYIVFYYFMYV